MRRLALALTLGAALATALLSAPASSASPAAPHGSERTCPAVPSGFAACLARVVTDSSGKPLATSGPSGYGPADIQAAYGLTGATSGGRTVAIVDAYNDPTAASDLATYRSTFGLPPCPLGSCLRIVNQTGGSTLPKTNAGWATEISLDLDMVSAACPDCKILLVEASSASFTNLGTAVNYAATQPGVIAISNSYGGSDTNSATIRSYYNHPGIAVTASTGDAGYGVESPASFPTVVAVGGTSLTKSGSTYSETAWSGAGSGCSTLNSHPAWQTGTQCTGKANADVSAVADPQTGVAVYDTTRYQGYYGWQVYGGTSASSPIIASVYALAGNFGSSAAQYTWQHAGSLHDVTSGSNGTCSPSLWCHAVVGWDGPTGLGSPSGTGSF